MNLKNIILIAAVCLGIFAGVSAQAQSISYTVDRIYGDGSRHCAFTSLVKFKNAYYCAFRDGYSHIFNEKGEADGTIRVIRSSDGSKWETAALMKMEGYDLRDPQITVTPQGKLMLLFGRSLYKNQSFVSGRTFACFSENGTDFSTPQQIVYDKTASGENSWLWKVTWHNGKAWGVNKCGEQNKIELCSSDDGVNYKLHKTFEIPGMPNESSVKFLKDGTMVIYVRRGPEQTNAVRLSAPAPYTDWRLDEMDFALPGPDAIVLENGRILIGGRSVYNRRHPKTTIYSLCRDGNYAEVLMLPSGGDCSYPCFLQVGSEMWISYYSSHENERPSIYLAKVPLSYFEMMNR